MKKFFTLIAALFCATSQMMADKVVASTVLPADGKPEHVYTLKNGNGVFSNATTAPTQTEANFGLFAFYAVEGKDNAYYIYSTKAEKWLTYTAAGSYSNMKDFVKLADSYGADDYFNLNNYADDFYEIRPYTTNGGMDKYLNWFQGVDGNPYDGANTLGLWQDKGAADGGSRWTFSEVVFVERTYTLNIPEGATIKIGDDYYSNGDTYTVEGSLQKGDISVTAPEGKFAAVAINDVNQTVTVYFATIPEQPVAVTYANAVVYPAQQTEVGDAVVTVEDGVYTLSNKVLAASFIRLGDMIYFGGSKAMDLVAGTEIFTVAFGNGDNVPASAMTLKSLEVEDLAANSLAIGGAEHFAGKQLVANYEYIYKDTKVAIVWRAVLRDGSHYLRTEMELTGIDDVDMYNVIPLVYNVDAKAAGSAPKVVGNTRGAVLMSNKIFAGLETPTAYNTVGGVSNDDSNWELAITESLNLTPSSWTQVAQGKVPARVVEATGVDYPNILEYKQEGLPLVKNQKVEVVVKYTSGAHRLNLAGADIIDESGDVAANDYHSGYTGGQHSNNTFTFVAPYDGTFTVRALIEDKTEAVNANCTVTLNVYTAKQGVVVNSELVGIQGLWSRNTTLQKGQTWKVSGVVGLIAQDGTQAESNIRKTQKRRSFLAYSERERAVPWRVFPHYNSWYELNINRNNAAPGQEHTNFTSAQVLNVMEQWKKNYYDKFGEGIVAFVIDDGWDNYGTWTFHSGFPNQMRDMSAKAKEMGAGIGAWLGPVGGYGQSGNYRRQYWNSRGGMVLSNPDYYNVYLDAARNLVCNQDGQEGYQLGSDNYLFFKYDGISGQFSATGPDAGDTGNENAEGIIRLEQYVRENMREDIFFNTTVGTWASPFWYQISDATWRQENDYGEAGNNSIDREKWITYRDRLVYQNYIQNSPICPINTLMTHGFILTKFGAVSKNMQYANVLNELRCAFVCGSGMVELYADYELMNSINGGKLWEDLAECVAWQKKNADVLPDAHWVGGNPWTGSNHEVYGWASWNGAKSTLALRNGGNQAQTYSFTLREAFEIPANVTGAFVLNKSFKVQDALSGLTEGVAIDIDQTLTVTIPASSVFAFDGVNADASQVPFEAVDYTPKKAEALETIKVNFNSEARGEFNPENAIVIELKQGENVVCSASNYVVEGAQLTITLSQKVTTPGNYTLVIPEGLIVRKSDERAFADEFAMTITAPEAIVVTSVSPSEDIYSLSTIALTFNKEIVAVEDAAAAIELVDANGAFVTTAECVAEGKMLVVTLAEEVTTPGEYTLVIPEGVIVGAAIGDAFAGNVAITVEEFDVYEPRNIGTKTRNDRNITKVGIVSPSKGVSEYELTAEEQTLDYVNLVNVETPVTFVAEPGETLEVTVTAGGSWRHHFVYVDFEGNGFTAAIEEGSTWKPAGDLVAYSFYNNDSASDESGWNSLGTVVDGGNRNTPGLPTFTAPATEGVYRMRFKQDWSNIDPQGDADGKFGDFKENGGAIVDVLLQVGNPVTGIGEVNTAVKVKAIYDLQGRKLDQITSPGIYIVNGKKQIVK